MQNFVSGDNKSAALVAKTLVSDTTSINFIHLQKQLDSHALPDHRRTDDVSADKEIQDQVISKHAQVHESDPLTMSRLFLIS